MLSKSVMSAAIAASCLFAAPATFAAMTDMPPPPMDQPATTTPAPPPMTQSMATRAPMDEATTGAPQTDLVTNGPQSDQGDHSRNWSAARNVRESQQYERLLAKNPHFRQARMRKECGPISDPQLHDSCMATFNGGEAMSGSSTPPRPISNEGGASQ